MTTDFQTRAEREGRERFWLLAALVTLACGLLLFDAVQNTLAEREFIAARQCALLSSDALWVYSVTQAAPASPFALAAPPPPADAPVGDWRALLAGMRKQRARLRERFPLDLGPTDAAWDTFQSSLSATGRVGWATTAALSGSLRGTTNTLESDGFRRRDWALAVSAAGFTVLLVLFVRLSGLSRQDGRVLTRVGTERDRLEALLEATGEGIYQVDARGLCVYINPSGAALLGYQSKELLGKEIESLLLAAPDETGEVPGPPPEAPVRRALLSGEAARAEEGLRRRDGSLLPAATLASPIITARGLEGAVVTFADTSERKQADDLRSDLTGMIVHDLRTPLTSLLSGLRALQFVGGHAAEEQEILENAIGGGETLLGMINDLLDIGKWEAGSLTLDRRPLAPADLIEYALAQTAFLARQNGLRVARHLAPDLPRVDGDEDKLRRALVNLLGNAVKFTPRGGIVTVAATYDAAEKAVIFAVGDTGEGIPAHAVKRIFDKFGQVESRKAGRKMSTGLGLTFCKLVAEAHGGRIWVESKLGKGSRFLFTIPACRAETGMPPVDLAPVIR